MNSRYLCLPNSRFAYPTPLIEELGLDMSPRIYIVLHEGQYSNNNFLKSTCPLGFTTSVCIYNGRFPLEYQDLNYSCSFYKQGTRGLADR